MYHASASEQTTVGIEIQVENVAQEIKYKLGNEMREVIYFPINLVAYFKHTYAHIKLQIVACCELLQLTM